MVLSAAGVQVNSIESLTEQVDAAQGEIELEVRRGRKTLIFTLAPGWMRKAGGSFWVCPSGPPGFATTFLKP